jgi:hypothetical protein
MRHMRQAIRTPAGKAGAVFDKSPVPVHKKSPVLQENGD